MRPRRLRGRDHEPSVVKTCLRVGLDVSCCHRPFQADVITTHIHTSHPLHTYGSATFSTLFPKFSTMIMSI
jgi:hypothetical protein